MNESIFFMPLVGMLMGVTVMLPFTEPPKQKNIGIVKLENVQSKDSIQITCMAKNIYFEARNQSDEGKVAVAYVVLNRVDDSRWPKTPCDVIHDRCQFSWNCDKESYVKNYDAYEDSYNIASKVYYREVVDNTEGSTFYHAKNIRPYWAEKFKRTTRIGDHIFYRG